MEQVVMRNKVQRQDTQTFIMCQYSREVSEGMGCSGKDAAARCHLCLARQPADER